MRYWVVILITGCWWPLCKAEPLQLVTLQYPPYIYAQNGQPQGVAVDLVEQAFADLGVAIEIRILPWARAISLIEHGQSDAIFTAFKTPERERFADYSREVLFTQSISLVQRAGPPIDWRQQGKTLSVCRVNDVSYGATMDQLMQQQHFAQVYSSNSAYQCMQMLRSARVDLWVNNEYGARVLLQHGKLQHGKLQQRLHIQQPAVQSTPSYIAFSKKRQLTDIRDRFDQALAAMKRDGRYQSLVDKAARAAGQQLNDTVH
ncbi:substrate-binding periplasmic protein [Bacterioplanes sanyensis]|uniref:substrate-binding periplasmic protein n=1 Tax=Bacterioplanes sanyensis TaxID=1249553 RepID=UPI0018EE6E09|nr:transporter substrate-binding domain-containing protein [Bacterioplanes sanyensis]